MADRLHRQYSCPGRVQGASKEPCEGSGSTTAVAYINNLGRTISKELVDLAKNLWMWCLEKNSSTPTRCSKQDSRCGVSDYERSIRLATESSFVQQDSRLVWSHRSGHVCFSSDHPVPSLLKLVARSLCSGHRCLPAGLVSDLRLCQPTLEPDRQSFVPGTDKTGTGRAGGTRLEDTALVPTPSTNVSCGTISTNA